MGIRKLNKLLTEQDLLIEYNNMQYFSKVKCRKRGSSNFTTICIDVWLYAYKYTYSYSDMLIGFLNQILKLLSNNIIPVYIFDGKPIDEKNITIEIRNKKRKNMEEKLLQIQEKLDKEEFDTYEESQELIKEKERLKRSIIYIDKEKLDKLKELLDMFHLKYIDALHEADTLCAKLVKDKIVTSCMSDDMDLLAMGCDSIIKFSDNKIVEYNLPYILDRMGINYDKFLNMCILLGTDYLKSVCRNNYLDVLQLIKDHATLSQIVKNEEFSYKCDELELDNFVEDSEKVKTIFVATCAQETTPVPFQKIMIEKDINIDALFDFIRRNIDKQYKEEELIRIYVLSKNINLKISRRYFY